MNRSRKWVALILCIVLVATTVPLYVFGVNENDTKLTIRADKLNPKQGETVTFTVSIGAVKKFGTMGTQFIVQNVDDEGTPTVSKDMQYDSYVFDENVGTNLKVKESSFTPGTPGEDVAFLNLGVSYADPSEGVTTTAETTIISLKYTVSDKAVPGTKLRLNFIESETEIVEAAESSLNARSLPFSIEVPTLTVAEKTASGTANVEPKEAEYDMSTKADVTYTLSANGLSLTQLEVMGNEFKKDEQYRVNGDEIIISGESLSKIYGQWMKKYPVVFTLSDGSELSAEVRFIASKTHKITVNGGKALFNGNIPPTEINSSPAGQYIHLVADENGKDFKIWEIEQEGVFEAEDRELKNKKYAFKMPEKDVNITASFYEEVFSFNNDGGKYNCPPLQMNSNNVASWSCELKATGGSGNYEYSIVEGPNYLFVNGSTLRVTKPDNGEEATTATIRAKDLDQYNNVKEIVINIGKITPYEPGGGTTPPPVVNTDATVTPTSATVDIYASSTEHKDVTATLNPGSYTLQSVKLNGTVLTAGTDYNVSGNTYTIKKEKFTKAMVGKGNTITFNMSGGPTPTITVTVKDSTPPPVVNTDATVTPTSATVDIYASSTEHKDVTATLNPGTYTLQSVKLNGTVLTAGTDYNVSGNTYTIKKEKFTKAMVGKTNTITFNMSGGATPAITVTVKDSTPPPVVNTDATVTPTSATVDIYASSTEHKDVTATLNPGSYTLQSVKLNGTVLTAVTDYNVSGNTYTIKKEKFTKAMVGKSNTITFNMSGGATPAITVTVKDSTPPPVVNTDATVTPTSATVDIYASSTEHKDVTATLNPGSYTLQSVKLNGTVLTAVTDYNVSGNTYTIKKEKFTKDMVGKTNTITFNMSGGKSPTVGITVTDSTPDPGTGTVYKIIKVNTKKWNERTTGDLVMTTDLPKKLIIGLSIMKNIKVAPSPQYSAMAPLSFAAGINALNPSLAMEASSKNTDAAASSDSKDTISLLQSRRIAQVFAAPPGYTEIPVEKYTISDDGKGTTTVTVKGEYMRSLETGTYSISIDTADKNYAEDIQIEKTNPGTGSDTSNPNQGSGNNQSGVDKANAGVPLTGGGNGGAADAGEKASTDAGDKASTDAGDKASTDTGEKASTDTGEKASTDAGKTGTEDSQNIKTSDDSHLFLYILSLIAALASGYVAYDELRKKRT